MKKLKASLCFLCIGLLIFCGCEEKGQFTSKLPDTFTLAAEYPEEYPSVCTTYHVDYFVADSAELKGALMDGKLPECYEYAEGPQYYLAEDGTQTFLNIYNENMKGGFTFVTDSAEASLRNSSFRNQINTFLRRQESWEYTGDDILSVYGNDLLAEYSAETDLSFSSYKEAYESVLRTMAECGIPECRLLSSVSCDMETMNKNREIYNEALTRATEYHEISSGTIIDSLSVEDEYYFFTFRQMLDGLPISNVSWSTEANSLTVLPNIHALYSRFGLVDFSAVGLYETVEARSSCEIISPKDAVDAFLSEYTKSLHFDSTSLLDIELNYVVVYDGKDLIARPAWILTTVTTPEGSSESGVDHSEINTYQFYAISADTGIILERETDTR